MYINIQGIICDDDSSISVSGIPFPDEYFELDEINNGIVVGKIRNGTLVNGGQVVPGIVGDAIEFLDANDEFIEYGPIHEPCFDDMDQCTDGMTITFWTDTIYTSHTIVPVSLGCGKLEFRIGVRFEIGANMFIIHVRFSEEYQFFMYPLNPPTGSIHHGVIIKKGQNAQYVMNGTLVPAFVNSITSEPSTVGGSVRIGTYPERLDTVSFTGKVDDIRLWKQAKCPEFVTYIFSMYKK